MSVIGGLCLFYGGLFLGLGIAALIGSGKADRVIDSWTAYTEGKVWLN